MCVTHITLYPLQHTIKIILYIYVIYANYFYSLASHVFVSRLIVSAFRIVANSVNLNCHFLFMTKEINDVVADCLLSCKLQIAKLPVFKLSP